MWKQSITILAHKHDIYLYGNLKICVRYRGNYKPRYKSRNWMPSPKHTDRMMMEITVNGTEKLFPTSMWATRANKKIPPITRKIQAKISHTRRCTCGRKFSQLFLFFRI